MVQVLFRDGSDAREVEVVVVVGRKDGNLCCCPFNFLSRLFVCWLLFVVT